MYQKTIPRRILLSFLLLYPTFEIFGFTIFAYGSVYFVAWSNITKIVHQHRSAYRSFFKNNMSFSRAILGYFSSKNFTDLFWVIPCFHIAKGDIWAPLVSSCGRSHTILFIPFHMMTSFDTASICQSMLVENDVRMGVPSWDHKELSKSYRGGHSPKIEIYGSAI